MEDIRVLILAGGKGTRLRPYTNVFPKPLMPVGDMPILEILLRQLQASGFREITISVNHLAKLIETFFGDGSSLGLNISYCIEDQPLGTAGSISLVEGLTDVFMVMNGDLLTTLDFASMVRAHIHGGADATIGAYARKVEVDFGVLELDDNDQLLEYREKPTLEYLVSMGVNVFNASVTRHVAENQYLDIPDLMMKIKNGGGKVATYSEDCEWMDIGRPDDYERAMDEFENRKDRYLRDEHL